MGDVLADLNRRRATIDAVEHAEEDLTTIRGLVPISEMFGTAARSQSQGRAPATRWCRTAPRAPARPAGAREGLLRLGNAPEARGEPSDFSQRARRSRRYSPRFAP
jgi:hypothetical protein